MSDLYFVEWDDKTLGWCVEQFESHREAEDFADDLVSNGDALGGKVTIR